MTDLPAVPTSTPPYFGVEITAKCHRNMGQLPRRARRGGTDSTRRRRRPIFPEVRHGQIRQGEHAVRRGAVAYRLCEVNCQKAANDTAANYTIRDTNQDRQQLNF